MFLFCMAVSQDCFGVCSPACLFCPLPKSWCMLFNQLAKTMERLCDISLASALLLNVNTVRITAMVTMSFVKQLPCCRSETVRLTQTTSANTRLVWILFPPSLFETLGVKTAALNNEQTLLLECILWGFRCYNNKCCFPRPLLRHRY